jgi:hypothetical protein
MAEHGEADGPTAAEPQEGPPPHELQPAQLLALATKHFGLLVSSTTFILVALRVLGTAEWNPTTALALVQVGGAGNVALSSALSVVPLVATLLLLLVMPWAYRNAYLWPVIKDHRPFFVFTVIGVWFGVYFATLSIFVLVVAWTATGAIRGAIARRHMSAPTTLIRATRYQGGDVLLAAVLGALILITVLETSYLPTERLDTPDTKPFTGFVVGERDDSMLVLRNGEGIEEYDTDTLTRQLCNRTDDSILARPLLTLVVDAPYPACPR